MEESVERISQKYRHPYVEIQEFNWIELLLATELILQTFRSFSRLPNQIWLIELALFPLLRNLWAQRISGGLLCCIALHGLHLCASNHELLDI